MDLEQTINELGKAFAEFKATVDESLKKKADVVITEKINRIDAELNRLEDLKEALEAQKKRADMLEKRLERSAIAAGDAAPKAFDLKAFNRDLRIFAAERGRVAVDVSEEEALAYKAGFITYLRKGKDAFYDAERKAMSVGSDPDGGYLVPADTSGRIVQKVYELSPIRSIANVQQISSDALEGLIDNGEAGFSWVGETGVRSETSTPRLGQWRIQAEEMYAYPMTTRKLLDDAAIDVEAWLINKVAERFARAEGQAFVLGDGVAKPRGFTTYPTSTADDSTRPWGTMQHINTGANGAFASSNPADVLFDVVDALKDAYKANARWVTRQSVITMIRKFKESTTNAYIWQPGLQVGQPSTLLGYPITKSEDMPALSNGSLSMAFGNFDVGYQIVDRFGNRIIRDDITLPGYVKFHVFRRVGGAVLNFEAIKFVRFGTFAQRSLDDRSCGLHCDRQWFACGPGRQQQLDGCVHHWGCCWQRQLHSEASGQR
jgi:HK97 family phage major capsid protein